jgi:membrane protease YdiL (CAAX protease family)
VRWGVREAVLAFVAGEVLSVITSGVAQSATHYQPGHGKPIPIAVTISALVGLWAGLAGGIFYASWKLGRKSLADDFGLRIRLPWDIPLGVAAGLAVQYVLVPLMYLPFEQFDHTLRHRLEAPAKQNTAAAHGGLQITLLFLFLSIGAPLVEELFFRGLLMRAIDHRYGVVPAVAGSAVIFGLAHFELLQLPALVLFGVVLALLAKRTGRLGPGIVAHATFNAVTVLTLTLK